MTKKAPRRVYEQIIKYFPRVCVDALIIDDKLGYLLARRKIPPLKGKYWTVGGSVYKKESLRKAILRKIREELGVGSRIMGPAGILDCRYRERHDYSFVFYVRVSTNQPLKISGENSNIKWFKNLPKYYNLIKFSNL